MPSVRKNILLATHNILKQNNLVREKLKEATDNLNLATEKLHNEIFATAKEKYQLREVANILFQHYMALKKDREKYFCRGEWKKYREEVRAFDKKKFSLHLWQKNYLQTKLEVERNRLEHLCFLPDSQKKILEIAIGILHKNKKVTKQVAVLDLQIKNLTLQIDHLYNQLVTLKKVLPRQKPNIFYKVRPTENFRVQNNLDVVSLIADAFLGESKAVPL